MVFKKNKISIIRFLLIFLIFIGSLISIVFGALSFTNSSNNQKGLFGDNYSFSFQLNSSSSTDNNLNLESAKQASDAFSNWLLYKNIYSNTIQYGTITQTNGTNNGIIYSTIQNVPKVTYRNVVREQNPNWIMLDTLNDSRVTIQQYNPNGINDSFGTDLSTFKYSPILTQNDIVNNSAILDTRTTNNTNGVQVDLNKDLNISVFNNEKSQTTAPTNPTQWFVFQNLDVLLEKLNYAKYIAYLYNNQTTNTEEITFYYETLPTDYKNWSLAAIASGTNTDVITSDNILKFYIGSKNSSTDPNANTNLTAIVEQFLLSKDMTNKSIDYSNYNSWFPTSTSITASTASTTIGKAVTYAATTEYVAKLSFQNSSATTQSDLLFQFKNTVINTPLYFSLTPSITDYFNLNPTNAYISKPYLDTSNVNSFSSYQMIFLAFGIILLILSIVVSVLYRIPGVFGSIAIVGFAIFSTAFLFLLNVNFSIPSIIAIFIGLIMLVICFVTYLERIRKSLRERNSIFDSLRSSFKKSFWTFIDVHVVALLFGLMFSFIGKLELADFGLSLVLVSLVSFASFSIIFLIPLFLLSGWKTFWNYKYFIFITKNYTNKNIKLNIQNKSWIFVLSILGIIFIILFSLISTLGINNSIIFNQGNVIYIGMLNSSIANEIVNLLPGNWIDISINNNILSASSTNIISVSELNNLLSPLSSQISSINIGSYSPISSVDIIKLATYALLAGFALSSVYYLIRLNLFISIPLFIINCLSTMFFVAFCYLTYMFIDLFFVFAMIFIGIISNLFMLVLISISKTRLIKNQIFTKEKISDFIKLNFIANFKIVLFTFVFIILSSVILLGLISPKTIWLFSYILIGTVIVIPLTIYLTYLTYYYIILFRQKYVKNIIVNFENKFVVHKYSETDEELVLSINKFN